MSLKLIGGIMIVISCGGFGFLVAASHRKEVGSLRQLISVLDYMECELQYRLTPLPELCRQAATESKGFQRQVFSLLAAELEDQISPDVERCMLASLSKVKDIPGSTLHALELLGRSLGRFDIQGQLTGLESVRSECRHNLDMLTKNQGVRLRSYKTLGLCAGAAIAILFI